MPLLVRKLKHPMQINSSPTTPFGRRPATLGQITAQLQVQRAIDEAGKPGSNVPMVVNKWQVFRTLTEVRERLGVSDRSLGVLNALLSFHQETTLSLPRAKPVPNASDDNHESAETTVFCDLVVFPSNRSLAQRAHGMASTTLWRHLTALVAAGLIIRRDSPNGKRYARKGAEGAERYSDAFGFDLTPLVTRAGEFEALAEELRARQKQRRLIKVRISLHRRDIGKLIALGLDEGMPGEWDAFRQRYLGLMRPLRRLRDDCDLDGMADDLAVLRQDIAKALNLRIDAQIIVSNDLHFSEHMSNSNTENLQDSEPAFEKEGGGSDPTDATMGAVETKAYSLGMVMEACPDVHDYGSNGRIRSWSAFFEAAGLIRPMIGISPDAWADAREVLGEFAAHVALATILQRSIHSSEAQTLPGTTPGSTRVVVNGSPAIHSAGGYLRVLTEKAKAGEFALGSVLMALIGQRLKAKRARAVGEPITTPPY